MGTEFPKVRVFTLLLGVNPIDRQLSAPWGIAFIPEGLAGVTRREDAAAVLSRGVGPVLVRY